MRKYEWLAPLTGVAFVVVLIIGFIVGGEPPDVKNPPQEIIDHYADNKDSVQIGVLLQMIAAALLLFFAGYLRKVLRAAPGEGGMLPAVALAGATVMAAGAAIDGTISFVLAESADDIEPAAVQALQAIWDNDWPPSPSVPRSCCLPAACRLRCMARCRDGWAGSGSSSAWSG